MGNIYIYPISSASSDSHTEVTLIFKDLHSGVFGGTVHEGMADLMYMMNTLVDKDGKILVEGIQDEVAPVTPGKYKCNVGYGKLA
jgi:hypothetical protein